MKKKDKRIFISLTLTVVALGAGFLILSNRAEKASANEGYQVAYNPTWALISQIGETARQLGQENDLYASVMIAQAILESNSGQSALSAAPHYNLFGVKGHYAGQAATMQTWEDDGQGNAYKIDANFRSYPSYYESLIDYVNILRQGYYANAWKSNTNSYLEATEALTGVYATDTAYSAKLNRIIEKYNLTQYDVLESQGEAGAVGVVYNPYRQQYTSQDVLNLDLAWANR